MWAFDSSAGKCVPFIYGGCEGNDNKFHSQKECEEDCGVMMRSAACRLPVDAGPCKAAIPMWAFDSSAGKCVPFIYGGCEGNDNKFHSQKECEEDCGVMMRSAVCRLPVDAGPCKAAIPMWAFDSSAGKCVSFIYGGCKGNDNKFHSQKECEEDCGVTKRRAACRLPVDAGPCKAAIPMWAFDSSAGKCVPFIYGGCKGNDNKFHSQKECEEDCLMRSAACRLPVDAGPCKAAIPMWAFDSSAGKCVPFIYGGCKGNDNKFHSQKECEEDCLMRSAACRLPVDAGPCKAAIPMWAFDSSAGKCVPFIYGGCKGNDNKFHSQKECEEDCLMRSAACRLPVDAGPCKAAIPMWAFDSSAGKCVPFIYGGCKGNDNKFHSQKECEEDCLMRSAACRLPVDAGPCKAAIPMWAFDSSAGKCVPFIYGGCEGNDNKFHSQKECEEDC
ncbi:hypothetical protein PO909_022277, partial [Leuciscus waleckii]